MPSNEEELKLAVAFFCEEAVFNLTKSSKGTVEIAKLFEPNFTDQTSNALLDPNEEGFSKLKTELARILISGVSPDELALKLSKLY